jgi:hypothetical protein
MIRDHADEKKTFRKQSALSGGPVAPLSRLCLDEVGF